MARRGEAWQGVARDRMVIYDDTERHMNQPDSERLRLICVEIEDLGKAGKLTHATYDVLWKQAIEAANGNPEALSGIKTWAIFCGLKA